MSPLRIGVTCHANFGGSGVIATELGLALASRGHDVHFICANAPPRLVEAPNVTLHEVRSPVHPLLPHGEYALALASRVAEVSRAHQLQVLHVHYALPLAVSALLAREMLGRIAPRIVTTLHGTDVLTLGVEPAFREVLTLAVSRSDAITTPSQFLANRATAAFGLDADRVEVIHNFVDTGRFFPSERVPEMLPRLFARTPRKVLIHNSNFRSLKRVQDVVRIFAAVQREVPCGLILVGDGPERAAAERLIREHGLEASVHLAGEQREVTWLLQQSDVFLMPSEVESFGLAALEAMACGVPVVASDSGGLPELVEHGVTGFLHAVGDVAHMSHSVRTLLTDEALHARQSHAARTVALERFRQEPIVLAYEALLQRLAHGALPR